MLSKHTGQSGFAGTALAPPENPAPYPSEVIQSFQQSKLSFSAEWQTSVMDSDCSQKLMSLELVGLNFLGIFVHVNEKGFVQAVFLSHN